jgi:hypothetical protein
MQLLNHKAIQGYAPTLDYEAHILVRSMYYETKMGALPINPVHFTGRYALKYVTISRMFSSSECVCLTNCDASPHHSQQHVDDILRDTYRLHTRPSDRARNGPRLGVHGTHR